jgi:hypothetical protein
MNAFKLFTDRDVLQSASSKLTCGIFAATFLAAFLAPPSAGSQTKPDAGAVATLAKHVKFDGAIKTKAEMIVGDGSVRFNVRNSRLGARGDVGEYLSYRIQVELSNEGVFSPLDLYGTLKASPSISILFGQQSIPFENNYVVTPAEMMFANRAFVGKYFTPGTRDIGAAVHCRWKLGAIPLETQGGIFNGGKINSPQWSGNPSFALRLIAGSMDGFRASAKVYKYTGVGRRLFFAGADVHYADRRWRIEAEAMNRESDSAPSLFGAYAQCARSFDFTPLRMFKLLTPAVRLDAMGYNALKTGLDASRITAGLNFSLAFLPYESTLRVDHEWYFLRRNAVFPDFDNRDAHLTDNKLTVELVVKF